MKIVNQFTQEGGPGTMTPADLIDPSKRDEEWHRGVAEFIYRKYINDRAGVLFSERDNMMMYRTYGAGMQDVNQYKKILLGNRESNNPLQNQRKGFYNVNWEIFSVAPKFKNVILGKFEDIDHDITVNTANPTVVSEKEQMELDMWIEKKHGAQINEALSNLGVQAEDPQYRPESEEELKVFRELGGFKTHMEIGVEQLIKDGIEVEGDWVNLSRKIKEDFIDIGIAATKDEVDPVTGKLYATYVDPVNLIAQYDRRSDFKNSNYFGHFEEMNIAEVRQRMPDLDEHELQVLARSFCGYAGNPSDIYWYKYSNYNPIGNRYGYDDFKVSILNYEWRTVDRVYKTKRKIKDGSTAYYKESFGKYYKGEGQRETKITDCQMIYAGKWIVGTKHVMSRGPLADMPRSSKRRAESSYHIYKLPGKPMMAIIKPNLDAIQNAWLHLQNANNQAAPPGLAIEIGTLSNISLGGGKILDPRDLIAIRRANGTLFYRATTYRGQLNMASGLPIKELSGGIGAYLEEQVRTMEINFQFIAELTGVDRISAVSGNNGSQTAAESKLAVAATNDALKVMYGGVVWLKNELGRSMACRGQLLLKYNENSRDSYREILGDEAIEAISIGASKGLIYYGMTTSPRLTDIDKTRILNLAEQALAAGKNGQPGITYPDYLSVERMVRSGNIKLAEIILASRMALRQKEEDARGQAASQMQDRIAAMSDARKLENDIRLVRAKTEGAVYEKTVEHMLNTETKDQDFTHNFVQEILKKGLEGIGAEATPVETGAPA